MKLLNKICLGQPLLGSELVVPSKFLYLSVSFDSQKLFVCFLLEYIKKVKFFEFQQNFIKPKIHLA